MLQAQGIPISIYKPQRGRHNYSLQFVNKKKTLIAYKVKSQSLAFAKYKQLVNKRAKFI